jgi:hypothetical protein
MWRLILQAGKFFLSKEAVPKGATELSKHASKKAGQAALDKAAKVQVKKVKPGSAIREKGTPESKAYGKGVDKSIRQRTKDFEAKGPKAEKIKQNRRAAMVKSQARKKIARQTGVDDSFLNSTDEFSSGGTVPKGGRAVSSADAKRGGRAVSNADAKRGGRAVSNADAKKGGRAMSSADARKHSKKRGVVSKTWNY